MMAVLRKYLGAYRASLLVVVLLLLLQAVGSLVLPTLNADIINNGVVTGDLRVIVEVGAVMLAVSVVVAALSIGATYFAAGNAMGVGRDLRSDLFRKVEDFSLAEMNQFGASSLITRNTNDVQQVQMLVLTGQTMMVSAPLMAFGGVFMALRLNVQLSALLVVIIPVMIVVIGAILSRAIPLFRLMQGKLDTINHLLREHLTGVRVIRAFVRTGYEEERFAAANADVTDVTLRVSRLFALMMPAMMLVFNLSSVAIVWFGGSLVADGQMPIGDLTAFLAYIMQILFSVMMAVMLLTMLPRASAAAERINQVLDTEPQITDPARPVSQRPDARGAVEFRDVGFRYPGAEQPVLQHVDLTIRPGETVAVVGGTGSGKSTLISLLPRLLDVTEGELLVGGVDVREQRQEELLSGIGFVPQRAFLFSGTVADNLRLGNPTAGDDQLQRALRVAQADFVVESGLGLELPVEQGGANLSGGQRQRLAIARALVRDADLYIFDDSFSALDYATEARLRVALDAELSDASVLVVAQRVSTIRSADSIVVLDAGRVVDAGSHDELVDRCPTYREIVASQLVSDHGR